MSRSNTDHRHDHTKLLLQPCLPNVQGLRQPMADGAKSKQSKTKLFHRFPFAMMISHHKRQKALLSLPLSDGRDTLIVPQSRNLYKPLPDMSQAFGRASKA